ncbi:MAG: hypothetical protein ACXWWC_07530 [Chitinophagaceae bacterium]
MKKIIFPLISILFIVSSCQFSKGVKKDLNTGLSTSYNGFALDDIYLADENGKRLSNNKITLGSKVLILATGVDFFAEKKGKVFPGCTIILTDKNKKEILNLPDAFANMTDGTTAAEAKTLQASLNTGEPMIAGETYYLHVRFYDKNKKENEIVCNVDLVATE